MRLPFLILAIVVFVLAACGFSTILSVSAIPLGLALMSFGMIF